MHKLILSIFFFSLSISLFAQVKHDSIGLEILKQIISHSKRRDSILYASSIPKHSIEYYKRKFGKKNVFYSYENDSLVLTTKERSYIINQFNKQKRHIWTNNLFPKSKTINGDSVWNTLVNGKEWEIFLFSKPIFIRNNSICLLHYMHFLGVGGPDYFGFYKLNNGEWRNWITISSGILN